MCVRCRLNVGGHGIGWERASALFLEHCRAQGLRVATIEGYRWFLLGARATQLRGDLGVEQPAHVTAAHLERLKSTMLGAGLAATTVVDWIRVWKTFLAFCDSRGWLTDAAALTVKVPRTPRRQPDVFSADDERRLLRACVCDRDRFLIRFAVDTGLRLGELCAVTIDDFMPAGRLWIVRVRGGKGGKDRGVPLSDALRAELTEYLTEVRPQQTACRALFLTTKRVRDGDYAPLSRDGLYRIWNRLSKATGVRAWPHKARHTFGTRLAADGLSPWVVRESLGHATFAATDRYVNASAIRLVEAFAERRR